MAKAPKFFFPGEDLAGLKEKIRRGNERVSYSTIQGAPTMIR
jgi:hypothetical protein